MRYSTSWHPLHKVPIVNGSYQNPITGEIEQHDLSDAYMGPPSVHIMWFNIHENSTFRSIGATFASSLDEAFAAISGHVRDNLYSLVSVNATLYAMTVVCSTSRADVEIGGAVQDMQRDLNRDVVIPEEVVAAVREWNVATGDENQVSVGGVEV